MKTYNVWGTIKFSVNADIDADNEADAIQKAKQEFADYFHLECYGGPNEPAEIGKEYRLYADEVE